MSGRLVKASASMPVHVKQDRVVQRLIQAEEALAFAVGIDQVRLVMDVAAAQEVFAKRQKLGEDVIGYAHAIKVRALGKLGDLLKGIDKLPAPGQAPGPGRGKKRSSLERFTPALSEVLNLPPAAARKVAHVAQQLSSLDAKTREAIAQRETTIAQVRREQKAVEIRKAVSLPDAKYRVLYRSLFASVDEAVID